MSEDPTKPVRLPDFAALAPAGGTGANKTADWTDVESVTPTLPFVRDGVHGTADWSTALGAPTAPARPGTEDWSFEPGTDKDAPTGGDGVNRTADWSSLLDD